MEKASHPPDPLRRLLVVDDEEIVLVALRETLVRAGYDVVATGSAHDALECLKTERFAVIITDQQMPRMTGLEFLAKAKDLQPDATRILITAVLNLGTVIDAINKGEIYRFILKPWLREEFLAAIESAVQRHALVAGNTRLRETAAALEQQVARLQRQLAEAGAGSDTSAPARTQASDSCRRAMEVAVRSMEAFHPTIASRARRVFELCRAMGHTAGLAADEQRALEIAGLLHDIGLLSVPRPVIRSAERSRAPLAPAERALYERHPITGEEFAGTVCDLPQVGPAIRAHHERFDGRGYPDGLAGESIPWLGRLLAVAAAWADGNESDEVTTQVIRDRARTAFDPEALSIFLHALPRSNVPRREREVSVGELRPGMVLARGLHTSGGVLLVPGGSELNRASIEKIRSHHEVSPISGSLFVYV